MVTSFLFLAGLAGGAICLAFLIGVAMTEPLAIVILVVISYTIWKFILWTERDRR